jgi:hypothetical protein
VTWVKRGHENTYTRVDLFNNTLEQGDGDHLAGTVREVPASAAKARLFSSKRELRYMSHSQEIGNDCAGRR